ncbi:hypothetical protein Scep_016961 [Stephania cephalantha]|uniref:Uncharacterized protein n=1 Tax=Stephania cephalantha TaxID=152367 RepID=A0AAP0NTT6_9MAGN
MTMDGAGLSQPQPPPPPPHEQQQPPQIDPADPHQQQDNVEREMQDWLTRDEQLGDVSTSKELLEGVQAMERSYGCILRFRGYGEPIGLILAVKRKHSHSVADPLLIRDGSETKSLNSVSDPFLINNGSETEFKLSVFDTSLITKGSL